MKIGDKLKDNDPRMSNRVLTITAIGVVNTSGAESVRAKRACKGAYGPEVRISTKRIFTDGKRRRYGFDLVIAQGDK